MLVLKGIVRKAASSAGAAGIGGGTALGAISLMLARLVLLLAREPTLTSSLSLSLEAALLLLPPEAFFLTVPLLPFEPTELALLLLFLATVLVEALLEAVGARRLLLTLVTFFDGLLLLALLIPLVVLLTEAPPGELVLRDVELPTMLC